MVILGISIGTRTSGIAIINDDGLIKWRTLSFKNSWSERKADYIVRKYERYVKKHKVTVVALKVPPLSHQTVAVLSILQRVAKMLEYHGCMVEYKTKQELKHAVPRIRNATDLMAYTATKYPQLAPAINRELVNRNRYHNRMFEAVLAAHMCQEKRKLDELTESNSSP